MPAVYLSSPGIRAALRGEHLAITAPATEERAEHTRTLPLLEVEQVTVHERASLTIAAMAELLRRRIPIYLLDSQERMLGIAQASAAPSPRRYEQWKRQEDEGFRVLIASLLIEAKILNSRRVLQRLAANRPGASVGAVLAELDALASQTIRAENLDSIRGYEGAAAGAYFAAYGSFFPENCPFVSRSRRPPRNPPNALLSFAYTLLAGEAEVALHHVGLEPGLGLLHEPEPNRASLALDIMEPIRAPLADALALDLLSHRMLKPEDHFETTTHGCLLNQTGRARFFTAYEQRMEREFTSRVTQQRTTLRAELQRMAENLALTIRDNRPFEPYLMN